MFLIRENVNKLLLFISLLFFSNIVLSIQFKVEKDGRVVGNFCSDSKQWLWIDGEMIDSIRIFGDIIPPVIEHFLSRHSDLERIANQEEVTPHTVAVSERNIISEEFESYPVYASGAITTLHNTDNLEPNKFIEMEFVIYLKYYVINFKLTAGYDSRYSTSADSPLAVGCALNLTK